LKKYILGRIVRAILSICIVVGIVIVLVYQLVPKDKMFNDDPNISKLHGDNLVVYKYKKWEQVGYLDYVTQQDLCENSSDYDACMVVGSDEITATVAEYEDKGYTINELENGLVWGFKYRTSLSLITNFFANLIEIDGPNKVVDESNPDLERRLWKWIFTLY